MEGYEYYFNKFRGDKLLIKDYKYWSWCLREDQVTLGSSILLNKACKKSFGDLSNEELLELRDIITSVEYAISKEFNYDKINYLALMMVDKHVHFHVLPRYSESILFNGTEYSDEHWPVAPQLSEKLDISETDFQDLKQIITSNFR